VAAETLGDTRAAAERAVAEALERAKGWPDPEPGARFEHVYA
jgi:TPP-dependent pyruvate/acetoin dehydrogenase alpha subunit